MAEAASAESSGLPLVAGKPQGYWGAALFVLALVAGGAWLFSALSANRTALSAPRAGLAVPADSTARIASPPPLALPPGYAAATPDEAYPLDRYQPLPPARLQVVAAPPMPVQGNRTVRAPAQQPPPDFIASTPPPRPAVVFDSDRAPPPASAAATANPDERVMAGRFAEPALTVPQGTIIPAVLETALDSTRPGLVRALVQRDVRGFDGSRVLIPRGSRLYGDYQAELAPGQNRALIKWNRLIRPDGVTIALDSPASDPLGRAGVKGRVDSKFFQRFGGALLQSVLDIGVGLATREASNGVVVALPGSTQNLQINQQQQVQPTLKVPHGTRVSVFVGRDLDFSSVES